jgi:hypothetical protein
LKPAPSLVAEETREGDVYRRLLEKLDQGRQSLGGRVFDVLGKLHFEGRALRDLLIEAIRYGEQPEVRARLTRVVDNVLDKVKLQDLLEERALAHDAMDVTRVRKIREEMERAEAKRLQPYYIESFFLEAFKRLGGTLRQREPRRYEVTNVPAPVRNRDRLIGIGEPVLPRYERIAFEKSLIAPQGEPLAAFVCPGHPLLDAPIDLTFERHRDLLRRGTILVDELDTGTAPRLLFFLEHTIQDAALTRSGERRVISRQMLYVEIDTEGKARHLQYAPYLDFRPLAEGEPDAAAILARPECAWISRDFEKQALGYAIATVVPAHLAEVRTRRVELLNRTEVAMKDRLTKEISYWDHRAEELKHQEHAGKANAKSAQPAAGREVQVGQEIDVLDIGDDGVKDGWGRLGTVEFVDDDVADEIPQRPRSPCRAFFYMPIARRPASVICSIVTIALGLKYAGPRSAVASPARTKPRSVPVVTPWASMTDSMRPRREAASMPSASLWSLASVPFIGHASLGIAIEPSITDQLRAGSFSYAFVGCSLQMPLGTPVEKAITERRSACSLTLTAISILRRNAR